MKPSIATLACTLRTGSASRSPISTRTACAPLCARFHVVASASPATGLGFAAAAPFSSAFASATGRGAPPPPGGAIGGADCATGAAIGGGAGALSSTTAPRDGADSASIES